jgi:hypothetical protein
MHCVSATTLKRRHVQCTSQSSRNYTGANRQEKIARHRHICIPQASRPGHYKIIRSFSFVILTFSLALLVGGLGKSLLPDGAGTIVIKVGEENVEDFRVPADRVALDALLDVL